MKSYHGLFEFELFSCENKGSANGKFPLFYYVSASAGLLYVLDVNLKLNLAEM